MFVFVQRLFWPIGIARPIQYYYIYIYSEALPMFVYAIIRMLCEYLNRTSDCGLSRVE